MDAPNCIQTELWDSGGLPILAVIGMDQLIVRAKPRAAPTSMASTTNAASNAMLLARPRMIKRATPFFLRNLLRATRGRLLTQPA